MEGTHHWDSPHDVGRGYDRSGGRRYHVHQKQARVKRAALPAAEVAFRIYKSKLFSDQARDGQGYIQARMEAEREGWLGLEKDDD